VDRLTINLMCELNSIRSITTLSVQGWAHKNNNLEVEHKHLLTLHLRLLFCFNGSTMFRNFWENTLVFFSEFLGGTLKVLTHSLRNSSRERKSSSWVFDGSATQQKSCQWQQFQSKIAKTYYTIMSVLTY
jgi:hypothetical protein